MSAKTIFIALDTDLDLDGVLKVAGDIKSLYKKASDAFASHASNVPQFAIKLGLEFFCRHGFYGVNKIEELGMDVFLDLKFFDISNTVCGAYRSLTKNSIGFVKYTTVHLLNGSECLKALSNTKNDLNMPNAPAIIGVSLLTSLDKAYITECGFTDAKPDDLVLRLANIGCNFVDGFVCSPLEAKMLSALFKQKHIITPGVQLSNLANDQKRTSTPSAAFANGATAIVIGRSITQAADKQNAIIALLKDVLNLS